MNSIGSNYKTVAIIISKHILHIEQYLDKAFDGKNRRSIIAWVEDLLNPTGYSIFKIINTTYTSKLPLVEAKRIIDIYPSQKVLAKEVHKMKKEKAKRK